MDIKTSVTKFSTGTAIPTIGYGSGTAWFVGPGGNAGTAPLNRKLIDSIKMALKAGFVHLDNALVYGNELENGVAIKEYLAESGKKREDIWITTKVWTGEVADIPASLKGSLKRLGLDYVDLYLIHAPFFDTVGQGGKVTAASAWKQMEQVKDMGLAREIGVSNWRIEDFEEIFAANPKHKPVINQIEHHPYLRQPSLVAYHKSHSIVTACYGPLASLVYHKGGPVDPVVDRIATRLGSTPAQVLLAWSVGKGNVVVTTSGKEERVKEYPETGKVKLSEQDARDIDKAGESEPFRQFWGPQYAPKKDGSKA